MKKLAFLAISLLCLVPTAAQARPGGLDPSFGQHGKLLLHLPQAESPLARGYMNLPAPAAMAMDTGPGGIVAAATSLQVIERTRDGGVNSRFGGDGRVTIVPPSGWEFELADLAVDSRGHVLVAGTLASLTATATQDPPQYNEGRDAEGPRPRLGIVYRYLPDGKLDPSFGSGGIASGNFLQKPPFGPGPFNYEYSTPAVGLIGLAVAGDDEVVVTGFSAAHAGVGCYFTSPLFSTTRSFVARLRSDGSLNPSFGLEGVLTEEQLERLAPPAVSRDRRIALDGASGGYCGIRGPAESNRLLALLGEGRVDGGFGSNGGLSLPALTIAAVSFDSRGRLLVVGRRSASPAREAQGGEWRVRRLLRNGSPDPSFGRNGTAAPKLPPEATLSHLAVDRRGRVVLAGSALQASFLLVTRLSPSGHREPGFGRHGFTLTNMRTEETPGLQVTVDRRGRALVGGAIGDFTGSTYLIDGLAFARYQDR
ncbi:MAG TPA: hypothetical protein VFJ65_02800 [Solirubrobacterales bacterium]|nr:hypothetical protein [Solirubrobacterales bacterium]